MCFRIFTEDFDYNLRFQILEVLVRVLYDHIFRVRVRVRDYEHLPQYSIY